MSVNPERPDEFEDLAAELKQAIPPLSDEAMQRVQAQLHAEMDRDDRRRRLRGIVIGGVLAASIAIAVVGYALTYAPANRESPPPHNQPIAGVVDERIRLAVTSASIAPVVEKALVRLDENQALFVD